MWVVLSVTRQAGTMVDLKAGLWVDWTVAKRAANLEHQLVGYWGGWRAVQWAVWMVDSSGLWKADWRVFQTAAKMAGPKACQRVGRRADLTACPVAERSVWSLAGPSVCWWAALTAGLSGSLLVEQKAARWAVSWAVHWDATTVLKRAATWAPPQADSLAGRKAGSMAVKSGCPQVVRSAEKWELLVAAPMAALWAGGLAGSRVGQMADGLVSLMAEMRGAPTAGQLAERSAERLGYPEVVH